MGRRPLGGSPRIQRSTTHVLPRLANRAPAPISMSSFAFTESVRIGQIGVGRWGQNLLRNLTAVPSA